MLRRYLPLLFLFGLLLGCTQNNQQQLLFTYGAIVDVPESWTVTGFTPLFGEQYHIEDEFGKLALFGGSNDPETDYETIIDSDNITIEIPTDNDVRIIKSTLENSPDDTFFEGYDVLMMYYAFAPNTQYVLGMLPVDNNLEIRETAMIEALTSVHRLTTEYDSISLIGGKSTLLLPEGWWVNVWNSSSDPRLETDNISMPINTYPERIGVPDRDDVTSEDIIAGLIEVGAIDENLPSIQRRGITILQGDGEYIFTVDNGITFLIHVNGKDGYKLTEDDIETVFFIIDSLILNTRDSYSEPINLRIP